MARLVFHVFVVVVGTLILSGAVNTAIVGSNGVLNRVSEDGVLSDWFRQPHPRFGTSHRIINMVVVLQIVTILISRGDVTFLANLYAFGVIWSFALKGIAVLVLRYTHPQDREFRVPLNFTIAGKEIPLGLALITLVLLVHRRRESVHEAGGHRIGHDFFRPALRRIRDFRKTDSDASAGQTHVELDQFNLAQAADLTPENVGVQPGNILVPVSTYYALYPLEAALRRAKRGEAEIVVLHVRMLRRAALGRIRSGAGPALQHHRAVAVHESAVDRGKGRQAGAAGGGRRERSVGRHSAHGGESAVEHDRGGKFVEDADHRAGARNRPRVGANAGAAAARDAGDLHAFGTGTDFLSWVRTRRG